MSTTPAHKRIPKLRITKLGSKENLESKSTHIGSTIHATAPTSATERIVKLPNINETQTPRHMRQSSLLIGATGPLSSERPYHASNKSEIVGIYDGNQPLKSAITTEKGLENLRRLPSVVLTRMPSMVPPENKNRKVSNGPHKKRKEDPIEKFNRLYPEEERRAK